MASELEVCRLGGGGKRELGPHCAPRVRAQSAAGLDAVGIRSHRSALSQGVPRLDDGFREAAWMQPEEMFTRGRTGAVAERVQREETR